MDVAAFDFHLPPELIAQEPAAERTGAKLMALDRRSGAIAHHAVADLPRLLRPGDVIVVNNTRVFPARLLGRRVPSGGAVECFLVRRENLDEPSRESAAAGAPPSGGVLWEALVHPGQKLKPGSRVEFADGRLRGEVVEWHYFGRRVVRLWTEDGSDVDAVVDAIGHTPLPPYIKRGDLTADRTRYQTMFARHRGSIAAPTAGLHFTPALVDALDARGIERVEITLHVGYGTFQPVRVERVEDHHVETEQYDIGPDAAAAIARAKRDGRRVVAVGTTTTRTLEAVARAHGGVVVPGAGATDLFIYPGFDFQVIDGLITNFHLPRSSLLMLVAAFAGRERVLMAYDAAIARGYRFYSYGDAMITV
ncbi:MAG TPA: tRNA preQ1(34) S-adenosylmethionine ribosyltransferase-isomerase QueA [Vicinamibacterales bacterium]|jgi:S-adenosylmethionine:tRNA ribosyltransferase-isomerase